MLEADRRGEPRVPHAYVVFQGEGTLDYAFALAEELRAARFGTVLHAGGGSFKSQMKKADASGALYALIVGEDELRANEVSFKFLRKDEEQVRVKRDRLIEFLGKAPEQKG
jgi:histidyl-tRNA synthetase